MSKKNVFNCVYEITNENWEVIKLGELRVLESNLRNAEAHFHDLMVDLMGSVDGADDYFLSEMRKVT